MIKILNQHNEHIGGVMSPDWNLIKDLFPDDDISLYHFDPQDLAAYRITQVRVEATRRMIVLARARDQEHLDILISNASREAIRLLRKGEANWSAEEAARAGQLEALDDALEAIRAASNTLEARSPIPTNFTDDDYWP